MAKGSILSERIKNLSEGCCPIHGKKMKIDSQISDLDNGTDFHYICPRQECKVSTRTLTKDGFHQLNPEHLYLIDPALAQLPHQSEEQLRGIQAATIASLALSRVSFVHSIEAGSDIGIDFICELRSNQKPTGRIFNIQCKAKPLSDDKTQQSISISIAVRTVRYWLEQTCPTVLVVVCTNTGTIYWTVPAKQISSWKLNWREQGTVSVHVEPNQAFKIFEMPPPMFMDDISKGASDVGTALQERYYSIEKMMKDIGQIGRSDLSPRIIAPLLMSDMSVLRESIQAAISLETFHARWMQLIKERVRVFGEVLKTRSQDVMRTAFAYGGYAGDFATWSDYLELAKEIELLLDRLDSIEILQKEKNTNSWVNNYLFDDLLEILNEMETTNQKVTEFDRFNYEDALQKESRYDLTRWASERDPNGV